MGGAAGTIETRGEGRRDGEEDPIPLRKLSLCGTAYLLAVSAIGDADFGEQA